MALTRGSVGNVILAITIAEIPRVSRLVRSVVLSLREQPYVDAAVASGTRTPMIILRHILPNTMAPMLVQATYICASAMIVEAILSFIGAGTPPTIPSWGNIMAEGRALWQVKPLIWVCGAGGGNPSAAVRLMRLRPEPPGKIAGAVRLEGKDVLQLSDREMRGIRGNDSSMLFQEPMTSLNPVLTVGRQIGETLRMHQE